MRDRHHNSLNKFSAAVILLSILSLHAAPAVATRARRRQFARATIAGATPIVHTYYLDYDQDSYGSKTVTRRSSSPTAPSREWVSWGNDPDDNNSTVFPVPAAKGGRTLAVDWSDAAEDGRWRDDLARELGVEATTLRLQWGSLETAPTVYEGAQVGALQIARDLYRAHDIKLNLSVSPVESDHLTVPQDLRAGVLNGSVRFADAAFINRYKALLSFAHERLDGVELASLQIGHELDVFFRHVPQEQFWADYYAFYAAAADHAKTLWGAQLRVGMTATHAGLVGEPTKSLMRTLNEAADVVSVTYYPLNADLTIKEPDAVATDLGELLALYQSKLISFQAVAYSSSALTNSSQTKQSQFLKAFFDFWDEHRAQIPFACFHRLHDLSPSQALAAIRSGDQLSAEDAQIVADYAANLGLRTFPGAGEHKAAYNTLRNLTEERNWWRATPRATRPYLMGFTTAPYDYPPDPLAQLEVAAYVDQKIAAEGDIMALHLEGGVPWVEAYQDTFQSPLPPYSNSQLSSWEHELRRKPAGHKLLVSITPLGIPRDLLAPYWGYGQGFTYTSDFKRVGDGVFVEGSERLPPAPWDTYQFDDEPVKIAYLNYCKRVIQYFRPDYLVAAIEVSALQVADPEGYERYLRLHQFVYQNLKSDPAYSHVPVMVSFSATSYMTDEYFPLLADRSAENSVAFKYDEMEAGVRERIVRGFRDILPYTDVIGLSLYPHYGKYNAYALPASAYEQLFRLFEEAGAGAKPIAVTECGYAAETFHVFYNIFAADPFKQDRFYQNLFYELSIRRNPVEFLISWQVRDSGYAWERRRAAGFNPIFLEFYKYFRDIGIYDKDGGERPATRRWRDELALPRVPKT